MKNNFIKQIAGLMVVFVLISSLTACGSDEKNHSTSENEPTITEETAPVEEAAPVEETAPTEELELDRKVLIDKYIEILEDIYSRNEFPETTDGDFDDGNNSSDNRFAIYDIDQDGKDELITEYTTTASAGMEEKIYGFDSSDNTVTEEFSQYPNLTFYDNGIIKAGWSHNQGLAGDFWPYTLYQYDKDTDTYNQVGMVDAWDKSLSETDYSGNLFPEDADVNQDGIVYYIVVTEEDEVGKPIDLEEYNQWYNSYVDNAKEVDLPFMSLTEENIHSIK